MADSEQNLSLNREQAKRWKWLSASPKVPKLPSHSPKDLISTELEQFRKYEFYVIKFDIFQGCTQKQGRKYKLTLKLEFSLKMDHKTENL